REKHQKPPPLPRNKLKSVSSGKSYNDNEWQLTSVSNPREKLTMNRWHMKLAGLLEQVEVKA
ncbi:hypothetical protein ACUN9W_32015, partial [Escherichia coli]